MCEHREVVATRCVILTIRRDVKSASTAVNDGACDAIQPSACLIAVAHVEPRRDAAHIRAAAMKRAVYGGHRMRAVLWVRQAQRMAHIITMIIKQASVIRAVDEIRAGDLYHSAAE